MTIIPALACYPPTLPRAARPAIGFKPLMIIAGLMACVAQNAKAAPASGATITTAINDVAPPATFDLEMLKSRGLDPKVSVFFSKAPRFTEGTRRVGLTVNGSARGSLEALFDAEGHLCFNDELLDQANLNIPDSGLKRAGDAQ